MIRLGALAWLIFIAFMGIGVFQLKYTVQAQEKELRKIRAEITQNLEAIHVLKAEWSYLNDPTRLADLARRHSDLVPITSNQIADISKIPIRIQQPDNMTNRSQSADNNAMLPFLSLLRAQTAYMPEDRALIQDIMARIGR